MIKTLGQIAFEIFQELMGNDINWEDVTPKAQAAWNEIATIMHYSHHFTSPTLNQVVTNLPCPHNNYTAFNTDGVRHCTQCGAEDYCTHTWVKENEDPLDIVRRCVICKKLSGIVIEETVLGGSSKLSGGVNKGGTG